MKDHLDTDRLATLYDIARGLVGLRRREEIVRHTLLSLMGSVGASFAAHLRRDDDGGFVMGQDRAVAAGADLRVRASERLEKTFLDAPVQAEAALDRLGPDLKRLRESEEIRLVAALQTGDTLDGLVVLGPRLFGEPYGADEMELVCEVMELTAQALTGGVARAAARPNDARGKGAVGKRLAVLRDEKPVLATIRGESRSTLALFEELIALAEFDLPVLIHGETGTGKELVARAVHALSPRADAPFEAISCAAIPTELVASALFGHERGAFTGAVATARGVFERAGEGTVFLDEVGDMPAEAQASLLRVLQERSFRRVGGEAILPARARIISATNADLVAAVNAERFRADLFYRIQMYTVRTLPLRERPEEVPDLVAHVLARAGGKSVPDVSDAFVAALRVRALPGNVRELEGLVRGALVRARGTRELLPEHLGPMGPEPDIAGAAPRAEANARRGRGVRGDMAADAPADGTVRSYEDMERDYIRSVLALTSGNKKEAAALMDIPRTTLNARMKKLGIDA